METRTISIDITRAEAREWVKQGGYLKELALKAFSEDDLKNRWEQIKSFEDLKRLNLLTKEDLAGTPIDPLAREEYQLQLVRKYMNEYEYRCPRLENQSVFAPQIRVVKPGSDDEAEMLKSPGYYTPLGIFKACRMDGKYETIYSLFAIESVRYAGSYLGNKALPMDGYFFGCRLREIADHFAVHFGRKMFEIMAQRAFMKYEWAELNLDKI